MAATNYLTRVEELIQRLRRMSVDSPEDTGHIALEEDVLRELTSLMEAVSKLLREIGEHYEQERGEEHESAQSAGDETHALHDIGAQIASQLAAQELANLAFVGRGQIQETRDALDHAQTRRAMWKVISHADAGLRRTGKALVAVESAIREFEGLPPVVRTWESLEDALEVRRAYGQFRRAILRDRDERQGRPLRGHLRRAAQRIAILRALEIYPYLRIDDRRQIRNFQKRIAAWLKESEDSPEHEEEGRRLWQDLVAFARLLAQVNSRQSLIEHDRTVVNRVIRKLFLRPRPDAMPADVLADLEPLFGRDDELDHLLHAPHACPLAAWQELLLRLQQELELPYAALPQS